MPRRLPAPTRPAVRTDAPETSPRHTATFSRILQGRRRQSGGLFLRLSRVFSGPFHGVKKYLPFFGHQRSPCRPSAHVLKSWRTSPGLSAESKESSPALSSPLRPCRKQKRKPSCGLHAVFFLSPRLGRQSPPKVSFRACRFPCALHHCRLLFHGRSSSFSRHGDTGFTKGTAASAFAN